MAERRLTFEFVKEKLLDEEIKSSKFFVQQKDTQKNQILLLLHHPISNSSFTNAVKLDIRSQNVDKSKEI